MPCRLVGGWLNEGWDGEPPSVEPSGLNGARVIVPHTTSREDKVYGRDD